MPEIPAAAGVHGRDQHKRAGEGRPSVGTGNGHGMILQGLPQTVGHLLWELGQLVHEQYAVVRQ